MSLLSLLMSFHYRLIVDCEEQTMIAKMHRDSVRVLNDVHPVAFANKIVQCVSIGRDGRMVRYESKNHK